MTNTLSLSLASLPPATLTEQLAAAKNAGFSGLSLWQIHIRQAGGAAAMREQLDALSLQTSVVESLTGWEGSNEDFARARQQAKVLYSAAETLGCGHVAVCALHTSPLNTEQLADRLAVLADDAAECGISLLLESLSWGAVNSIARASQLLRLLDRANVKLLLDSWHLFRSGWDLATLASLPADSIAHIQLSDAPKLAHSNTQQETMQARALPGQGDTPFAALFAALPQHSNSPEISLEVFNTDLQQMPIDEAARHFFSAFRSLPGVAAASAGN